MEEFFSHVDKIKNMISKVSGIASGTAIDDIDISVLKSTADKIADSCFAVGKMTPTQSIARKDAYDFVVACSRLSDVLGMTRADYYTKAVKDSEISKERVDYAKAAVVTLESAGSK